MGYVPVDINQLKMDEAPTYDLNTPEGQNAAIIDVYEPAQPVNLSTDKYVPVDINKLQLDGARPNLETKIQRPGYIERVRGDLSDRQTQRQQALADYLKNDLNTGELVLNNVGNTVFGSVNDIIGQGLNSAGYAIADATPEAVKAPISAAVKPAADLAFSAAGGPNARAALTRASGWLQENPRAARNLSAVANIASVIPIGKAAEEAGSLVKGAEGLADDYTKKYPVGTLPEEIPPTPKATADSIKEQAQIAYAEADRLGGRLTPKFTDKFVTEVSKMKPQTEAGRLLAGDSITSQVATRMEALRGKPLSLQEAQEIDEFLGDMIDGQTVNGTVNKQGKKLLDMQSQFREMIEKADSDEISGQGFEALKEGRSLWAQQAKLRDIEKIITRAESMDNPATGLKTGFRTLYNNPKRMRGYTDGERALIKKAAETGIIGDTLRTFGSRLIPIASTVGGGGLGTTVASQAASMASRGAATKLQLNRANKVAEKIIDRPTLRTKIQKKTEPEKPMLALPAPKSTVTVDSSGRAIKLTEAERDVLGKQPDSPKEPTLKEIMNMPPKEAKEALDRYKKRRNERR